MLNDYVIPGVSTLVEWNDANGQVVNQYLGYQNQQSEMARVETAGNKFVIAGDDNSVKVQSSDRR